MTVQGQDGSLGRHFAAGRRRPISLEAGSGARERGAMQSRGAEKRVSGYPCMVIAAKPLGGSGPAAFRDASPGKAANRVGRVASACPGDRVNSIPFHVTKGRFSE